MVSFLEKTPEVGGGGGNLQYPDGTYNECMIRRYSAWFELLEFFYEFRPLLKGTPTLKTKLENARKAFFWDHLNTSPSETIWNACMMFRRGVLEANKEFDEDMFVWYADRDWCHRAIAASWKVFYLADAEAVHYERQSNKFPKVDAVRYKSDGYLSMSQMDRDKLVLMRRHHSILLFHW
jgi:GT2 family glycosyltransferase